MKREDGVLRAAPRLADRRRAATGGRCSPGWDEGGEYENPRTNPMKREDGVLRAAPRPAARRRAAMGGRHQPGWGRGSDYEDLGTQPMKRERAGRLPGWGLFLGGGARS